MLPTDLKKLIFSFAKERDVLQLEAELVKNAFRVRNSLGISYTSLGISHLISMCVEVGFVEKFKVCLEVENDFTKNEQQIIDEQHIIEFAICHVCGV